MIRGNGGAGVTEKDHTGETECNGGNGESLLVSSGSSMGAGMRAFTSGCLLLAAVVAGCSKSEPPSAQPAAPVPVTPPAAIGSAGRLFVTNENGGDISVIDVASHRVTATIPVGKRPRGIRLSPDGKLLYVALSGSPIAGPGVDESKLPPPDRKADGIGVISVADQKLVKIIRVGTDPEQSAVSADGKRLFIANEDAGEASVINIEDEKILGTFKVGGEPEGVQLRPDGKVVYVTSEEDGQVAVIDANALKLLKTIKVGPRPRSTTFLPDSSRAYVTAENGAAVWLVDAQKHDVIKTIHLSGQLVRPMGGVAAPDGSFVYITTGRGKNVLFIDTKSNEAVAAVEAGERPWGIAVSPDGKTLFTANGPSNDVSIIDVGTKTITAKVMVGDRPWGVAFVP